jgi:hypothetical protein
MDAMRLPISLLFGGFFRNIFAGLQLMLCLPVERSAFRFGASQLAMLWVVAGICFCTVQIPVVWPVGGLSRWGISFLLASYFSMLAALHLGSLLIGCGAQSGRLQVMVLSTMPAAYILIMGIQLLVYAEILPAKALWGIYAIYLLPLIAAVRGTSLLAGRTHLHGLVPAKTFAGSVAFNTLILIPFPIFDHVQENAGEDDTSWNLVDIESIYYAQPKLLEAQLRTLRAGVSGRVELFALLAAYYPDQKVFLREVEAVGTILEDRFSAEGRVVRLANSRAQPDLYPLANRRNLDTALKEIARQMNRGEDVLLIYLTSHGSKDIISAGYWELEPRLRESGRGTRVGRNSEHSYRYIGL